MRTWLAAAFSEIMLDQQMPADAFDIEHSEGSAFAEGHGRAMALGRLA
jgi:hypothetical protein